MVDKNLFFTQEALGQALNTNFLGRSLVEIHPDQAEIKYKNSQKETDVFLIHGAPDKYEMDIRFYGASSDMYFFDQEFDLSDSSLVTFSEEYNLNAPYYEMLEDEYNLDVIVPDEEPDTTVDDWKAVEDLTSSNDSIRSFTSGYHGYKARKTGEYILPNQDKTVFALSTERDTFRNQMLQNADAHTRQWLKSFLG